MSSAKQSLFKELDLDEPQWDVFSMTYDALKARLAEAERALRDICRVDKAAPGRKDCYIWADMLAIASGYFRDENGLYPDDAARAADSAGEKP